ncbi:hypothetical protein SPRG_04613 [Saprolegnia parasitica CBS 223.65]|uniref:Choloylglycine hydrolase/NAAA C-terminal domain-containing protein n=1 Tax=Saprolegnia parasitica (strain CBS 223.65) TaxID=695850 RepID=A0A067CNC2_SAPPC|nr:hypothetical protein SPRG_04613 [Saprolegnia parasitica CBS 223.65]KDO30710.1 hypothetical protein SPRG_04613 [Saprolegnia parasitica CBS 223.65]|eukprot:XP_012198413.1 hypothetical protein SPRG_04613 [Saprolegnia parasitica CBS 223.65]
MQLPALLVALLAGVGGACSDFLLNSTTNVISARSVDFIMDLQTSIETVPIGTRFVEAGGFQWRNSIGFVSFNVHTLPFAADGLNTKGLSAAWLFMEETVYPEVDENDLRPAIGNLCSYILGNFASVDDVVAGFDTIQPVALDLMHIPLAQRAGLGPLRRLPMHIAVHDAFGASLVVEFLDGKTHLFRNALGVLTNAPSFPEHLTALSTRSGGTSYSSTNRFARLVTLNAQANTDIFGVETSLTSPDNVQNGVARALHLLSTVVQPVVSPEFATEWVVVRDHARRCMFVQATETNLLRRIDLGKLSFAPGAPPTSWRLGPGIWFLDMEDGGNDPIVSFDTT